MSMEMCVLSDRQLNSISEWQNAIDAEGFLLKLSDQNAFEDLHGFLPAQLRGEPTGFECDHWSAGELMRAVPDIDFGHDWKYVLHLRWGASFKELRAVWVAAAAYAKATNGIVIDDQELRIRNAAEAIEAAHFEYEAPDPKV